MSDLERLARQIASRRRPDSARAVGDLVESIARTARRQGKQMAELVDLWEANVPPHVAEHTRLAGMRGGVLHVELDSASALYEVDRLLRGGVEQQLRSCFGGTLLRVRLKVSSEEPESPRAARRTSRKKRH